MKARGWKVSPLSLTDGPIYLGDVDAVVPEAIWDHHELFHLATLTPLSLEAAEAHMIAYTLACGLKPSPEREAHLNVLADLNHDRFVADTLLEVATMGDRDACTKKLEGLYEFLRDYCDALANYPRQTAALSNFSSDAQRGRDYVEKLLELHQRF